MKSVTERFDLAGKNAFVTGGAGGIGLSVALALAECGVNVAVVDIDGERAERAAHEIEAQGVRAISLQADITNPEETERLAERCRSEFDTLDIAFNNAGICINEPAETMSFESWRKVIDINLTGVFLCAQAAAKLMIPQKSGSIVNTASMSGHIVNRPQPQCAYNASKAGVIQLTKSLAVEWAPHGVRVNCISPGYIATDMTLKAHDWIPAWNSDSPFGRMGAPEELQGAVLYLASEAATYTSGTDLVVDGCFTAV